MSGPVERGGGERLDSTRLADLWRKLEKDSSYEHASVIIPSLSFDAEELAKISGVAFYEERLLFLLMRLRNPAARALYVTSHPIPEEILEYYLDLLAGVPGTHARRRLKLLCVHDVRPVPLTEKILERPRTIARIRSWIGNPKRAYLTCFNSTALERSLAQALDIPLNGVDPDLLHLGTKSGSRRVFRRAGTCLPDGFEEVFGTDELIERIAELGTLPPPTRKAAVKLNSSFSGQGNAVFTYPEARSDKAALAACLADAKLTSTSETVESFCAKLALNGGIVERFIEADEVRSPSVQMRITPTGEIQVVSTHEQVLGGETGQAYEGCRFPALDDYRALLQQRGIEIAEVLRSEGVVSRFAVDFLAWRSAADPTWQLAAIEVNLRMGGTTFPFLALEFLTNGRLDEGGNFLSQRGTPKYYVATDAMKSPNYRGLLPEDLLEIAIEERLIFDPDPQTGVLFHMIGALSQYGKLGVIAIGDSREQAQTYFEDTRRVLNEATGTRRKPGPATATPDVVHRMD